MRPHLNWLEGVIFLTPFFFFCLGKWLLSYPSIWHIHFTRLFRWLLNNKEDLTEITDGTFKQDYAAPTGDYNVTVVVDNQKLAISFLNNVYVDPNGNDA